MAKITVTNGGSSALIDGVIRKNVGDDSFYFIDRTLILQTSFSIETLSHEIVIIEKILTSIEKEILDRLLIRLKLQHPSVQNFELYGNNGWKLGL